MEPNKTIRCVIVTPEQAVLDEPADFVAVPLYDGELGILPDRAPMIGRLGIGELRLKSHGTVKNFFIDGGFIQVRNNVVTLLTSKAIPAEAVDARKAEADLQAANAKTATTPSALADKSKALARARAMLRMAAR